MIILEGVDGSGKTTLAQAVVDRLTQVRPSDEVEVWHKRPPKVHPLDEYETPLLRYRPGTGHHIVCDRWHVGEWVYPLVLGRESVMDVAVWRHIEMFLRSRGAVVVYTDPGLPELEKVLRERGDDFVTPQQLPLLLDRYRAVVPQMTLPTVHYDYRRRSFADVAEQAVASAAEEENRARVLGDFVTYVGPARPHTLLLGDVRHELRDWTDLHLRADETIDYGAAFGPYRGTSGHYLLSYLPQPLWRSCGVANACDVDDWFGLYLALGSPRVATLGRRATSKVRDSAYGAAPHPQYVRRFFNRHGPAYGSTIQRAVETRANLLPWRPSDTWYDQIGREVQVGSTD